LKFVVFNQLVNFDTVVAVIRAN